MTLGPSPQVQQQQLDYIDGAFFWQTTVGLVCNDNCPGPRAANFMYARPPRR
jgi:hypothetical protein